MKHFFLLCALSFTCLAFSQNNYGYYIDNYAEAFNAQVEHVSVGTYNLAFAFGHPDGVQSHFAQHTNGSTNWAVDITGQQSDIVLTDQVLLPNGNTALTGIYGDVNTGYDPFIALFDGIGNLLVAQGYTGFNYPFSATHQIVHDVTTGQLIVSGSNRVQDPFVAAYCPDQSTFVLAVDINNLSTVNWCSTMDSGPGVAGNDFDLAENILVLNERIFITGSTNDPGSGDQLTMYALLDAGTGISYYSNSVRIGSASFGTGAAAIATDQTQNTVLVMVNTDQGIGFVCVEVGSGTINNTQLDNSILAGIPTGEHYGYTLLTNQDDPTSAPITVAGYVVDPGSNPIISPFYYDLELEECGLYPINEGYYFLPNNTLMLMAYFGNIGGIEYINTPDMACKDNSDLVMMGYDDTGVAISHFDYGDACNTACVDPFTPSLTTTGNLSNKAADFIPVQAIAATSAPLMVNNTGEDLVLTCESNLDCPLSCPAVLDPVCGFDYTLSADCIPACYNPQYTWNIPGLGINQMGSTIAISDFGGTYSYTLTVSYINPDGTSNTCIYNDEFVIPDFDCSQVQATFSTSYLYNMDYQTTVQVSPSCLQPQITIIVRDANGAGVAFGGGTGNSFVFDWTASSGSGTYDIEIRLSLNDGRRILNCDYFDQVFVPTNCLIEPPQILCQIRTGFNLSCSFGDNTYLELFPNQVNICYTYQWIYSLPGGLSSIQTGPSYIHCDENNPPDYTRLALRIIDNCNGCIYYFPSIADMLQTGPCTIVGLTTPEEDHKADNIDLALKKRSEQEFDIHISPNPTRGIVNVSLPKGYFAAVVNVTVHDAHGRQVKWMELSADQSPIKIDLSNEPSGLYFLRYSTATDSHIKTIILGK